MNDSPDMTATERIESLKAGTLAALSFTLAYSITVVGNNLVLVEQFDVLAALQITSTVDFLVRIAIA